MKELFALDETTPPPLVAARRQLERLQVELDAHKAKGEEVPIETLRAYRRSLEVVEQLEAKEVGR